MRKKLMASCFDPSRVLEKMLDESYLILSCTIFSYRIFTDENVLNLTNWINFCPENQQRKMPCGLFFDIYKTILRD